MARTNFVLGEWLAQCFRCGLKRHASEMRKQWQGYWVCPEHWEPRQPQDFVRGVPDNPSAPWQQPKAEVYVGPQFCTPVDKMALPDYAIPDCSLPNNDTGLYS